MVSDLFSSERTLKTTSIFYYNDYKVLIDVILRKLNNLSASDQVFIYLFIFLDQFYSS